MHASRVLSVPVSLTAPKVQRADKVKRLLLLAICCALSLQTLSPPAHKHTRTLLQEQAEISTGRLNFLEMRLQHVLSFLNNAALKTAMNKPAYYTNKVGDVIHKLLREKNGSYIFYTWVVFLR